MCRHAQLLRSDDHVYLVERRNRQWHWHQVGAKSPPLPSRSHTSVLFMSQRLNSLTNGSALGVVGTPP